MSVRQQTSRRGLFVRENGIAMFTVGDPGYRKSYSSKLNFIRSTREGNLAPGGSATG
jgi:hypothetical protein